MPELVSNIVDPIAKLLGAWSSELTVGSVLFRIALSVLLSSVIGCERSSKRHAAGLRTFILVSLATTCSMLLDIFLGLPMGVISAASVIGIAIITVKSILYSSRNQIICNLICTDFHMFLLQAFRQNRQKCIFNIFMYKNRFAGIAHTYSLCLGIDNNIGDDV